MAPYRCWLLLVCGAVWIASSHSVAPAGGSDIQVFIHVHCVKQWATILEEQFHGMLMSGLLERVSHVHVVMNSPKKKQAVNPCLNLSKVYGSMVKTTFHFNDKSYERVTLNSIRKHVTPHTRILYMHSKGVSRPAKMHDNIALWRRYMEYFLIRHWETCVCMMNSGKYDTVGVNLWLNPPWPHPSHYNGNFWWSTGEWWLSLRTEIGKQYNDPEFHLLGAMKDPSRKARSGSLAESRPNITWDFLYSTYFHTIKPSQYHTMTNWTMAESVGCRPRASRQGAK